MPQRIQRHRTKGWTKGEAMIVDRTSRWGNPFTMPPHTRESALELFESYAMLRAAAEPEWLAPLHGKDLACSCPREDRCHADILLVLANAPKGGYLLIYPHDVPKSHGTINRWVRYGQKKRAMK
jgi:hypothetical protein